MTADEIQRRIGCLQRQIDDLLQENNTLRKKLDALEEGGVDASSLYGKWESVLSDCYGIVKTNLEKVDPTSGFSSYYLERINAILSSKEANEISECLSSIKSDTQKRITEIEDKIESTNTRIFRYQKEIDELCTHQITGV